MNSQSGLEGIGRASCKTGFSVILNEVQDLNLMKIRDYSLLSA
jgi:hypothetical protein